VTVGVDGTVTCIAKAFTKQSSPEEWNAVYGSFLVRNVQRTDATWKRYQHVLPTELNSEKLLRN